MADLNLGAIVEILNQHDVRFVIIGGIAAQLLDLPVPATIDIDLTPSRDGKNLDRLADAFDVLEAGLFTTDQGGTWFPRRPVENWAQYDTLHLMTIHGPLDLVFAPDGALGGYEELAGDAIQLSIEDQPVLVISASTWETLKQASGRAKDLQHLDQYYERRSR